MILHLAWWHPALPLQLLCVWGKAQRPNGNMVLVTWAKNVSEALIFVRMTVNFCQSGSGGGTRKLCRGVCVCMCICVFESVSIYMCVCVLMCVWLCFWMYVNVWVCACMCAYVCSCVCGYMCISVYVWVCDGKQHSTKAEWEVWESYCVISNTDSVAPLLSMWHGNQPLLHKSLICNSNVVAYLIGFCER